MQSFELQPHRLYFSCPGTTKFGDSETFANLKYYQLFTCCAGLYICLKNLIIDGMQIFSKQKRIVQNYIL